MSDKLLSLLGVDDELSAVRAIEQANQFLKDVKDVTGRDTFAESISVIKACITFEREIRAIATKEGADKQATAAEAIGTFLAWQSSHNRLPEVEKAFEDAKEKVRAVDVQRLIDLGLQNVRPGAHEYAGKLTPATAEHFKSKSPEELEAYLKVAPRVMPGERTAPPVENVNPTFAMNGEGRITDSKGRTFEEIQPSARVQLKKEDQDLYNAMREDWEANGRPAGVVDIVDASAYQPSGTSLKFRQS